MLRDPAPPTPVHDASSLAPSSAEHARLSSRRAVALLSLIGLMIVWGSTFVVVKAAVRQFPPLTLAALRFGIAAFVLVPLALARGGLARLPQPIPLGRLAWMALTGVVLFSVGFNHALVFASATQGAMIYALQPAAIGLVAVLALGEVPSRRRVAGILLSVTGVALVVASGKADLASPAPLLGGFSMLLAVLSWAAYTVFAKRFARSDQIVTIACVSVLGALMMAPLSVLELSAGPWPAPTLEGWAGLAFLAVVTSALAFIVYGRVLRELDASLVGAYSNLDPIVGVLSAVLVLGEMLYLPQVAGGVIALAGMWLASTGPAAGAPKPGPAG